MKVSIVIPVYNEALAIHEVLRRVAGQKMPEGWTREIVVVDDGSSDNTYQGIQDFVASNPTYKDLFVLHRSIINQGKGSAVRVGFKLASGDVILIQDGDLEYSPSDYPVLLAPFEDPACTVVYGTRFSKGPPAGMKLPNLLANYILTWTTRILYGQVLTDEATGFKVFRRSILNEMQLTSRGFEFCPEFTSKALLLGHKIIDVPIQYNPRGIMDGKKIKARDGFVAIWWLIKLRLFGRKPKSAVNGHRSLI